MENNITPIVNLWKEEISVHIKKYAPYQRCHQLNQMASLFSPGLFYYYILNFQNIKMDYVHPGTRHLLGVEPEEFSVEKLLKMLLPHEIVPMGKKENLVIDFLFNFLKPSQNQFYKIIYFIRLKDVEGSNRTILHQANALKVSDTGKVEHVLGIHTDVSHLNLVKNDKISFISLDGGPSYYNLDPEKGNFDPKNSCPTGAFSKLFTNRELEVIKLFAEGETAAQVGEKIFITENTVRTHRRKILKKSDCSNMTELVGRCLVEGVI